MRHRGLMIARSILLITTFTLTTASMILMIVQFAISLREKSGFVSINEKDELPF